MALRERALDADLSFSCIFEPRTFPPLAMRRVCFREEFYLALCHSVEPASWVGYHEVDLPWIDRDDALPPDRDGEGAVALGRGRLSEVPVEPRPEDRLFERVPSGLIQEGFAGGTANPPEDRQQSDGA